MLTQGHNDIIRRHTVSAAWTIGKIGLGVLLWGGVTSWRASEWKTGVDTAQAQLTGEVQTLKQTVTDTRSLIEGQGGLRQEMATAIATLKSVQEQLNRIEERINR